MKRLALFALLIVLGCRGKDGSSCDKPEKKMDMYQMSEMASLMEQMYVDHQRVRAHLLKGEAPGAFPAHFLKIRTAKMTDASDNDEFFRENAEAYLTAEAAFYAKPSAEAFNDGVDACLKCHEQKCGGPIPRIKKLYIR